MITSVASAGTPLMSLRIPSCQFASAVEASDLSITSASSTGWRRSKARTEQLWARPYTGGPSAAKSATIFTLMSSRPMAESTRLSISRNLLLTISCLKVWLLRKALVGSSRYWSLTCASTLSSWAAASTRIFASTISLCHAITPKSSF